MSPAGLPDFWGHNFHRSPAEYAFGGWYAGRLLATIAAVNFYDDGTSHRYQTRSSAVS